MSKKINLHIKELVLEGFDSADRHRIGDAVERELARLLAINDAPPSLASDHSVEQLHGGTFEAARGAKPEFVGAQIAAVIHGGLR